MIRLPRSFYTNFVLLFLNNSLFAASYVMPSQLLGMGFSQWRAGVLMSAFFVGAFVTRPAASRMIERFGIKRSILAGVVPGAAAGVLMLSGGFAPLLFSRFCLGVAGSVLYVAVMAYQGLSFTAEERGRVVGFLTLASILPQFLLVPLSEYLIDGGMQAIFMLLSSAVLTFAALFALTLPKDAGTAAVTEKREWGSWGELFSRRDTWALLASFFVVSLTTNVACQYVPNLMRSLGLRGSSFTQTMALTSVLIRLSIGALIMTSFDRRRTFTVFAMVEAASMILAGRSASTAGFVLSGVAFGVSHGIDFPAMTALLPDTVPAHLLPKGASAYLIVYDVATILVPLAIGAAPARFGMGGVIGAAGALGLVAFPLIYFFLWRPGMVKAEKSHS